MTYPIDRSYYRIHYPLKERPVLELETGVHDVVDCSEAGLRYVARGAGVPDIGAQIRGTLRFRRGAAFEVGGTVVRLQEGTVAVHLLRARIPLAAILDEQRYLRKHYPMLQA